MLIFIVIIATMEAAHIVCQRALKKKKKKMFKR